VFDTSAPQQWGAYSYGDNNPVAYWDPSGLWSIKSAWNSAKKKASSAWKATTRFVNKYQAEIVGGVVGGVVTAGCLAATAGAGSVGCAALGGAAAGAATNLWKSKVQKTQKFSWAGLARDVGVGAVVGGVTGSLQGVASAALRRGVSAVAAAAQRGAGAAASGARAAASGMQGRVAAAVATGADRGSISLGSAGRESVASAGAGRTAPSRFIASSDGVVTDTVGSKNAISIGHYPAYVMNAQATGARTFSMSDDAWNAMSSTEQWARNQRFLDDAISRGSEIQLATPLSQVRPGSYLEREIGYLAGRGFAPNSAGNLMVPGGG
jgi:hypothetical protein